MGLLCGVDGRGLVASRWSRGQDLFFSPGITWEVAGARPPHASLLGASPLERTEKHTTHPSPLLPSAARITTVGLETSGAE